VVIVDTEYEQKMQQKMKQEMRQEIYTMIWWTFDVFRAVFVCIASQLGVLGLMAVPDCIWCEEGLMCHVMCHIHNEYFCWVLFTFSAYACIDAIRTVRAGKTESNAYNYTKAFISLACVCILGVCIVHILYNYSHLSSRDFFDDNKKKWIQYCPHWVTMSESCQMKTPTEQSECADVKMTDKSCYAYDVWWQWTNCPDTVEHSTVGEKITENTDPSMIMPKKGAWCKEMNIRHIWSRLRKIQFFFENLNLKTRKDFMGFMFANATDCKPTIELFSLLGALDIVKLVIFCMIFVFWGLPMLISIASVLNQVCEMMKLEVVMLVVILFAGVGLLPFSFEFVKNPSVVLEFTNTLSPLPLSCIGVICFCTKDIAWSICACWLSFFENKRYLRHSARHYVTSAFIAIITFTKNTLAYNPDHEANYAGLWMKNRPKPGHQVTVFNPAHNSNSTTWGEWLFLVLNLIVLMAHLYIWFKNIIKYKLRYQVWIACTLSCVTYFLVPWFLPYFVMNHTILSFGSVDKTLNWFFGLGGKSTSDEAMKLASLVLSLLPQCILALEEPDGDKDKLEAKVEAKVNAAIENERERYNQFFEFMFSHASATAPPEAPPPESNGTKKVRGRSPGRPARSARPGSLELRRLLESQ